jgi:hypothetical protein
MEAPKQVGPKPGLETDIMSTGSCWRMTKAEDGTVEEKKTITSYKYEPPEKTAKDVDPEIFLKFWTKAS